jgi:RNA polymerase sigma-70 factor (ECF subfamily)
MSPLGTDEEIEVLTNRLLHFFLSKKASSLDDAWDLVQETLLRVLQTSSGEKLDSLEGYSIGVAKKITYEYYRKRLKANKHDSIDNDYHAEWQPIHEDTPERQVIYKDLVVRLHYGMAKLPSKMRDLLHERFIKEVPTKVIAARTGKNPSDVDMRVYRAKERLRRCVR